jgi:hypothetical protein
MSPLAIIWPVIFVTAGAVIVLVRNDRRRRSAGRQAGEPTFWTWVERLGWCFGIVSGVAAVWTLAVPLLPGSSQAKTVPPGAAPSVSAAAATVVVGSDGYVLVPCSWIMVCNDGDKVDLDTGHPGHGSASLQVGPARDGGPAEIILEDDRIHSSDTTPRFVIAPGTAATAADCENLLGHRSYRRVQVGLEDLTEGTKVCVETNEKHVTLVDVMRISLDPVELRIAFTTWKT